MIATKSPILQMLNEKIDVLSLNPVEKKLYKSMLWIQGGFLGWTPKSPFFFWGL